MSRQFSKNNTGFHNKKSLGQNFITDDDLLDKLVDLAGVTEDDTVLEIGTGAGALTEHLAGRCKRVVTIEIDDTLIPILSVSLGKYSNVELIHTDILKTDIDSVMNGCSSFHVVANIPYYITTDIINHLLKKDCGIQTISLMVQAEAAERIYAKPGESQYGMLSVRCAYKGYAEKLLDVPASAFTPPPKVDSAFVKITLDKVKKYPEVDEKIFMKTAEAAFLMRRKTFVNNLCGAFGISKDEAGCILEKCGLDRNIRGEMLDTDRFAQVATLLSERKRKAV